MVWHYEGTALGAIYQSWRFGFLVHGTPLSATLLGMSSFGYTHVVSPLF
jgi:hypothetical protein